MELVARDGSDARIITVMDRRIDAAGALAFKEAVRSRIEDAPMRVVLDLTHVEFIDSSGLGAIVATMKVLKPDHKLELAALQPIVAKVFALTRMDRVFDIHPDLNDISLAKAS